MFILLTTHIQTPEQLYSSASPTLDDFYFLASSHFVSHLPHGMVEWYLSASVQWLARKPSENSTKPLGIPS